MCHWFESNLLHWRSSSVGRAINYKAVQYLQAITANTYKIKRILEDFKWPSLFEYLLRIGANRLPRWEPYGGRALFERGRVVSATLPRRFFDTMAELVRR